MINDRWNKSRLPPDQTLRVRSAERRERQVADRKRGQLSNLKFAQVAKVTDSLRSSHHRSLGRLAKDDMEQVSSHWSSKQDLVLASHTQNQQNYDLIVE